MNAQMCAQTSPLPQTAVTRPSLALLGAEPFRAALEFVTHKLASRNLHRPGDGHPVLIFPGLAANGSSVAPLREHCRALGYEAFDWGRGFNTGPQGDVDAWLADLTSDVSKLLKHHDQPATLIGWSLGGLYAREVAKQLTPRVRQVITIGTPFNAENDHTNVGWLYRKLGGEVRTIDDALHRQLRTPPPVPTTSIYSRSDGVVAWQTCRHHQRMRQVQDIEVDSSHVGMGWNRQVLQIVQERLLPSSGPWRRHVRVT